MGRLIAITGDRHWGLTDLKIVQAAIDRLPPYSIVIAGDARGVDELAKLACIERNRRSEDIAFIEVEANWKRYGRAAGPRRNSIVLGFEPEELWYFHRDLAASKGTKNCVEQARFRARAIPVLNGLEVAEGA